MAQAVKNPPALQETWVRFPGQEDPLEKATTNHSDILAWRIPWTEEPGGPQSMGLQRVRHNWVTLSLSFMLMVSVYMSVSTDWMIPGGLQSSLCDQVLSSLELQYLPVLASRKCLMMSHFISFSRKLRNIFCLFSTCQIQVMIPVWNVFSPPHLSKSALLMGLSQGLLPPGSLLTASKPLCVAFFSELWYIWDLCRSLGT